MFHNATPRPSRPMCPEPAAPASWPTPALPSSFFLLPKARDPPQRGPSADVLSLVVIFETLPDAVDQARRREEKSEKSEPESGGKVYRRRTTGMARVSPTRASQPWTGFPAMRGAALVLYLPRRRGAAARPDW